MKRKPLKESLGRYVAGHPNLALNLAPFSRWTLRGKAAQAPQLQVRGYRLRPATQLIAILLSMGFCLSALAGSPTDEAACKARKGWWTNGPGPQRPDAQHFCVLPAIDAGKKCSSFSDCSSNLCLPKNANLSAGTRTIGECAAFNGGGCIASVQDGVIQPTICSD